MKVSLLFLVSILTFFRFTTGATEVSEKSLLLPSPNLLHCQPSKGLQNYSLPCRRQYVRNMTATAWSAYRKKMVNSNSTTTFKHQQMKLSFLSSLSLMNLPEEFCQARGWVRDELRFDEQSNSRSLIGLIGHLMSAYALEKDTLFLRKAVEIARLLEPTFSENSAVNQSHTFYDLTHPELTYLANILGPSSAFSAYVTEFQDSLKKLARPVFSMAENGDSKFSIDLFLSRNKSGNENNTRLVDILRDFYYNLLRLYVQSNGHDVQSLEAYSLALNLYEMTSNDQRLFSRSPKGTYLYVKDEPANSNSTSSSGVSCSLGAMLALGQEAIRMEMTKLEKAGSSSNQTTNSSSLEVNLSDVDPKSNIVTEIFNNQSSRHRKLAEELTSTCQQVAFSTPSHLLPQCWSFSESDAIIPQLPLKSLLTPELAESLFTLYRLTGEQKYREWAWTLVQAIEAHSRMSDGFYGTVEDVTLSPSNTKTVPPTFFSGTLKYLYLIFSDDSTLPLRQWIFNQAGNPLPICGQSPMYSETLCRWHNQKQMHHY